MHAATAHGAAAVKTNARQRFVYVASLKNSSGSGESCEQSGVRTRLFDRTSELPVLVTPQASALQENSGCESIALVLFLFFDRKHLRLMF